MGSYTVIVFILRQNTMDTPDTSAGKLNVNRYATKKTLTQGMLDIALLTANASQLKFDLTAGEKYENYALALGLIITSIFLQLVAGVLFLVVATLNINDEKHHRNANILTNTATVVVFIITFLNIVMGAFGFESSVAFNHE